MGNQQYISLAEVARAYGVSPSWLRRLAQRGELRAQKIARNWITAHAAGKRARPLTTGLTPSFSKSHRPFTILQARASRN